MTHSSSAPHDQRRLRIILLTQWFDPEPTFKGVVFARALAERGFDVEVVTGFPNYPGGKLYPGYRIRLLQRETVDGIRVTRLPLYPSHDQGAVGRIANYVSFFLSCVIYLTFFARKADVVYTYHPPLTVGLAAAVSKLFRRTPTIIDIQDMWPDTLRATGMINSDRALKLVGTACKWLYRRVSHIVVLSPGFRKLLIDRGVPAEKISIIYNWADEASIATASQRRMREDDASGKFQILFAGNMGRAQALNNVLEAAALTSKTHRDIEFCFLGGGLEVDRLKEQATALELQNVKFLPQVSMAEVGAYLAAADCLLVHLRRDPLFDITIPSKTQAYMAAGQPIIISVAGDAADLVDTAKCGLSVEPENPVALSRAIIQMAEMDPGKRAALGKAAQDFYNEELSVNVGVQAFSRIFRDAAAQRVNT